MADADHLRPSEHHPADSLVDGGSPAVPDYELADELTLSRPEQYRALFEDTRLEIVSLLLERAATGSELADVLGKPKGTIGHHLKVLEDAGLVRVVRTKRVRAIEAKYYGRTARVFLFEKVGEATNRMPRILETAAKELQEVDGPDQVAMANVRYARIPRDRAWEWRRRLNDLADEFAAERRGDDIIYGLVVGLYETTRRSLPATDDSATPESAGETDR
ncbi:ArsR family transcriptional regulator [Phytoactinopolyspora halotolerans]|uniref:ArsR family transcriptional regulator n=2 Tax=Phytoactinopolyspora halotolerans TaxID=1981512 RepID=A0A6L9S1M4_9ACTN|nr:ArsR family transcriptional regulator [Phytoactinopolyspora halotolerans]